MHIIRDEGEAQRFRARDKIGPQKIVRQSLTILDCMKPPTDITFELVISIVNRREEAEIGKKAQKNCKTRNLPPAGEFMREFVQNSPSDSLPANNSSQISPCSVHSGVTDPEIWTSSTFKVPWP